MAAGVREIARRTGLSAATVSNALRGKRGVSEPTRERVLAAARDLGYDPSEERADRLQTTLDTVRLVVMRDSGRIVDNTGFRPFIEEGLEAQARRHGLATSFMTVQLRDEHDLRARAKEICSDTTSANVFLATEMREQDYELFLDSKAPIVLIDSYSLRHPFEAIIINNETSAYNAVRYLIARGHASIGYLGGTFRAKNFPVRKRGLERALAESGLKLDERLIVSAGNSLDDSYEHVSAWLDRNPKLPTAFFADNDTIAVGAMRAFVDHGIRIPEDVSLIGLDDLDFARVATTPLTTMRVPIREMGSMAVRKAVRQARTPRDYRCVTHVCTTLVERRSVADLTR